MPDHALAKDHVRAALTLDQLSLVSPKLARGDRAEVAEEPTAAETES